ncbi:MAG: LysM domain-containing protein [Eubacteriales bacterium]|nr:LysM domain-containing protein [Eubacteriales bacterium]
MLQIPKNVMQIGEVNPHTKIYMEDYVHTFLERRKKAEEYLAFGKKEERGDVFYYLIYGVEKKTDWDRGSFPYFKNYERIGTIEGPLERRVFKPVRGSGTLLDGYFIFYEQNEDMQSYMIVVREAEDLAGSEEKEEVMEAVRTHREQRRKELNASAERMTDGAKEERIEAGERKIIKQDNHERRGRNRESVISALQKNARKNTLAAAGRRERKKTPKAQPFSGPKKHTWTIPDLCRAGSLALLLILVVLGLTSVNRYPDMKAVTELFSDAAKAVTGEKNDAVTAGAPAQQEGLIVEEAAAGQEATVEEAFMDEAETENDLMLADENAGQIQWTIGQQSKETDNAAEEQQDRETESASEPVTEENAQSSVTGAETEENAASNSGEEEAAQAIARPVSYVVKKGDSLAGIARQFYGDASMVKEICTLNQIQDPDQIRPGQNILLP